MYEFDAQGRVIKEINLKPEEKSATETGSAWEYEPETNKWKYYVLDPDGKKQYMVNKAVPIVSNGHERYFIFDGKGYMLIGL